MPETEPTIEEALKRLEAIAERLADPELDLDKAVKLYEEGLRLYERCAKKLDAADLRITSSRKRCRSRRRRRTAHSAA